jgi:hypothetical protein
MVKYHKVAAAAVFAAIAFPGAATAQVLNEPLTNVDLSVHTESFGTTSLTTYSEGVVVGANPSGPQANNVQAVALTEANGLGQGIAESSATVGGGLTADVSGFASSGITSFSGSLVNGTGAASSLTGGTAFSTGGGAALSASQ